MQGSDVLKLIKSDKELGLKRPGSFFVFARREPLRPYGAPPLLAGEAKKSKKASPASRGGAAKRRRGYFYSNVGSIRPKDPSFLL